MNLSEPRLAKARTTNPLILAWILSCCCLAIHAADRPWYETSLVGLEVGPTGAQFGSDPTDTGYAARFYGRDIVQAAHRARSEYLVIWARDGEYAYYNSSLMPKCPGLGERDVLRETMDEAAKVRMPIIAYCVLQYPTATLRQHPEFEMRGPEGQTLNRVCFNSGYAEYIKGLLDEMLAYGIAGFHLDMVDQGFGSPHGCWCDRCKSLFRERYDTDMPAGATWDEAWDRMLEFRYDTSARFEQTLRDHVRRVRPGVTVDFNYHGNPPFSWEVGQRPVQHAGNGDFVTGETGIWAFSALGVGLHAAFYRAATPGVPYQVAMQRGVRMYHDQTTRPLADLRWELFTLLAHGAFVTIVDKTAYDGWLDPVAYERFGEVFGEAQDKREHFGHAPLAEVGLYFSSRTRDWYGREDAARYFMSFQGAHKAMVFAHIPFGVILDENVTLDTLRTYPVVCLPNVAILSEREVSLFRQYVENGGQLLVTGQSGLYDPMGNLQETSMLAELIGARLIGVLDSLDNHMRFPKGTGPGALTEPLRPDWPFLVKGPATLYESTTASAYGDLMKPHRTVRQRKGEEPTEWPMSADEPVGPAVLINCVGRGRVLTLAGSPDYAAASDHHVVEARRLLSNAVRLLHPDPVVRVDAPANVEVVVTDDPDARLLRIHLLAYQAQPATTPERNRPYALPGLMETPPISRVTLHLDRRIKSVRLSGRKSGYKKSGRTLQVITEDVHEVVQVRYGGDARHGPQ